MDLESKATLEALIDRLMDRIDTLEAKFEAMVQGLSATIEIRLHGTGGSDGNK